MPKAGYVLLNGTTGVLIKAYTTDIGGVGNPTAVASDLEIMINAGYLQKRELATSGGNVLLVLEKP